MIRSRRKKLIALCLLGAVVVAVLTFQSRPFQRYVSELGFAQIRKRGIPIVASESHIGVKSFSAKNMEFYIAPIMVILDSVNLSVRPTSLAKLAPHFDYSVSAYGGQSAGSLEMKKESLRFEGNVQNVLLSQHPQLLGFGVTSGTLSADVKEFVTDGRVPRRADISIDIENLDLPYGLTIPPRLSGAAFPVQIPPVKNASLHAELRLQDTQLELKNIAFRSNLLSSTGELSAVLTDMHRMSTVQGSARLELSSAGQEHFGPFLPLVPPQGSLKPTTDEFKIVFSREGRRPFELWASQL